MNSNIETLLDAAEDRYLKPEELTALGQYVTSLSDRLAVYRTLRDQEVQIMQPVVDQLQTQYAQEPTEKLERCIKNALLVLRYCAMAMLLDDENFVRDRISGWLTEVTQVYNTQAIDQQLYRLLEAKLAQTLSAAQVALLKPHLQTAQTVLMESA